MAQNPFKNNQGKKKILMAMVLLMGIFAFLPFVSAWSDDSTTIQSVTGCNTLNTTNAVYTLIQNVSSTDTCFDIQANNITLDCQGYEINYSSNGGNYEYGVYSTYDFTTVKNCNIIQRLMVGEGNHAIYYFDGASNGIISNNIITTSGDVAFGISLQAGSSNNFISNNKITTYGSTGRGISLQSNSNNNLFSNNIITTSGTNGYGIYLQSCSNNIYLDNIITTSGIYSYGISLISDSNNNSFSNMNILGNNSDSYSFYFGYYNQNFTIRDSILNSSLASEFFVNEFATGGIWNFINVTRSDGKPITINWQNGANGTLNMMWYLDVNVTNSTNVLENANVTSYDVNNNLISSSLTGSNGLIRQTLLEYKNENNTLITYYSNYTIYTLLDGYDDDSQSVNMSMNRLLNVVLTPTLILSERFSITGQTIYEIMNSAGAGLGSFMINFSQGAFVFLVIMGLIAVFIIIGFALAKTIIEAVKNSRR